MPSISRRRLLAGGAAVGVAGGLGLLPAKYLPASVAQARLSVRPVPEVSARPPVTDGHEASAHEALQSLVDRAESEWSRVEDQQAAVERLPGLANPERSIDSARDYLDDIPGESGWEVLFSSRIGAQFAGEAIGGTRLAVDEASGESLAEQAREIQANVADERERVTYEVTDPATDLARLYWVEKWLHSAQLNSYRTGVYVGQDEPTVEYDDHEFVRTWGSHMQARRSLADAARLYDDYRDGADGEWRDLTDHVETVESELWTEARERSFTTDEFEERSAAIESLPEGPLRTYRWQAMFYVQNANVEFVDDLSTGLPLYRAVGNAETVLRARALADAPDDPFEDSVPVSLLARTKRDGLALLRDHLDAVPEQSVRGLLLREGRRLLWAGDTQLDNGGEVDHPRARAYARYRLGVGYLRHVDEVAARLDRPA